MNKKIQKASLKSVFIFTVCISIYYVYTSFVIDDSVSILAPPSLRHWFGTDLTGGDIFINSMSALCIEILTLLIVLPVIYYVGLATGTIVSYFSNTQIRDFFLNLIRYWATLPVLLLALFLLILIGSGQKNAIIIIIFLYIPTQALYVYHQLESIKKQEFVLAIFSYGFSKLYIYNKHLLPNIKKGFINYTIARVPEIIMLNLSLNFLGLGAQPPINSFGRMLFDGLSFMFSAWWMWIPSLALLSLLFIFFNLLNASEGTERDAF